MLYPFLVDSSHPAFIFLDVRSAILYCYPAYLWLSSTDQFCGFCSGSITKIEQFGYCDSVFFINGGLGFFYYFPNNLSHILSETVNSPTHLFDQNIIWSNVICDLIIPQRTTLGGWTFLLLALWHSIVLSTLRKESTFFERIDRRSTAHDSHPFIFSFYCCGGHLVYLLPSKSRWEKKIYFRLVNFSSPSLFIIIPSVDLLDISPIVFGRIPSINAGVDE
jgi:hypothetical protein